MLGRLLHPSFLSTATSRSRIAGYTLDRYGRNGSTDTGPDRGTKANTVEGYSPPALRQSTYRLLRWGAIYNVPESEITVEPFEIPPHWPRARLRVRLNRWGSGFPECWRARGLGNSPMDRDKLLRLYWQLGLKLSWAEDAEEAGIQQNRQLLVEHQLKVFKMPRSGGYGPCPYAHAAGAQS